MSLTKPESGEVPIVQAIGMPPKQSIAGERQAFPSLRASSVMPVALLSKGLSAEKSLFSKLGTAGDNSPRYEECFARFFRFGERPCSPMSLPTAFPDRRPNSGRRHCPSLLYPQTLLFFRNSSRSPCLSGFDFAFLA